MADLARIGVAIDSDLLQSFDKAIARRGYTNRSEAFRDLIRDELSREQGQNADANVVGTITLLYDHHVRLLTERLTETQHHHHGVIVSSLHVHLSHHDCLEVLVVRGTSAAVRNVADQLIATKGVKHGKLVLTAI
ncbi:MAG: nickel-responsive transcriptional regulator NikR [Acidobacteria bacterium]|nr:nickel-responsive transcriptional regulator NikR [Acidobacteriota bacterium]